MEKLYRIPLFGARRNRLAYRFFIFIGLLALFSLFFGVRLGEDSGTPLLAMLTVCALGIGALVGWFMTRSQRERDRSQQLAAEVTVLFPNAAAEELNHAYTLRRRREMRLEALWYLCFAALGAVWFVGMYLTGAEAESWMIGFLGIVPGLLLVALVLLIRSARPVILDEEMPAASALDLDLAQSWLYKKALRIGHEGKNTVQNVSVERNHREADAYLKAELASEKKNSIMLTVGKWFFCVIPLILFVSGLILKGWFLLFTGILALAGIGLWICMTHVPGGIGPAAASRIRLRRLKKGLIHADNDVILSHEMEEDGARIVLEKYGTVWFPCGQKTYAGLFPVPRHEAIVVTCEDKIQSIALLPDDDGAPEAASPQAEDDAPGIDILLSDAALRDAALKKIDSMPPSRKREMEAEIQQEQDQLDAMRSKGYFNLTTLEQGEIHSSGAAYIQKASGDFGLKVVEDTVMEKLHVSRAGIINMKKNPFAPALRRKLLIAAAVALVGNVGTALAAKMTGANLDILYLIFSVLAGALAMSCAEELTYMGRFRKLQKAYRDPAYRKKVLDAAVYREIRDRVIQSRQGE